MPEVLSPELQFAVRFEAVVKRADRGDEKALLITRQLMERLPELCDAYGNIAAAAESGLVDLYAGRSTGTRAALQRKLANMRVELAGPRASPLEKLVVERVVVEEAVHLRLTRITSGSVTAVLAFPEAPAEALTLGLDAATLTDEAVRTAMATLTTPEHPEYKDIARAISAVGGRSRHRQPLPESSAPAQWGGGSTARRAHGPSFRSVSGWP